MLFDCSEMLIASCRSALARDRRGSRRDDHVSLGVTPRNFIVNHFGVIGAIGGHRCDRTVDLIKQIRHHRDVADIVRRQLHCDDFVAIGIHREMKLAPASTKTLPVLLFMPFSFAVHLETRTIDQQMQGFATLNRFRQESQAIATATEGRVIRNADVDAKKVRDRSECSLDLAQPEAKNQTQRQPGLYREIGINRLTASLPGCRRMPRSDCLLGHPYGQASPPDQGRIILRPVRNPVFPLRYLVTAGLVEFVGHRVSQVSAWSVRLSYRLSLDPANRPNGRQSTREPSPIFFNRRSIPAPNTRQKTI